MLEIISIIFYLPRLDLWPKMWSILENLEWKVLQILVMSIWSSVSFKACVPLLIFCLDDLSTDVSGGVKAPHYDCYLQLLLLWLLAVALYICCSYVEYIYIYNCYFFFLYWSFNHYAMFFVSCDPLYFKFCFVWYVCCYSCLTLESMPKVIPA